jgi:hypothetical protein
MKTHWKQTLVAAMVLGSCAAVLAQASTDKVKSTPAFCQRDPEANFKNEGRDFCAPTSLSDSLIYLNDARGNKKLVKNTDHRGQVKLIKKLAKDMGTDPRAGTGPDQILTGLQTYISDRGYSLGKLEIKTWRPLIAKNNKFLTGPQIDLGWLRTNANDPDMGVILNVGWYRKGPKGVTRDGGHWVAVVGAATSGSEFYLRNPLMQPAEQQAHPAAQIQPVPAATDVYRAANGSKIGPAGLFQVTGPGLVHGNNLLAIVDGVIIYKVKHS